MIVVAVAVAVLRVWKGRLVEIVREKRVEWVGAVIGVLEVMGSVSVAVVGLRSAKEVAQVARVELSGAAGSDAPSTFPFPSLSPSRPEFATVQDVEPAIEIVLVVRSVAR